MSLSFLMLLQRQPNAGLKFHRNYTKRDMCREILTIYNEIKPDDASIREFYDLERLSNLQCDLKDMGLIGRSLTRKEIWITDVGVSWLEKNKTTK